MMKDTKEIKNEQREYREEFNIIKDQINNYKQREYREEFNIIKDQINNYKQVIGKVKTENEELKREMKKMQEAIVKIKCKKNNKWNSSRKRKPKSAQGKNRN
ncbi:hypothetical protein QE152_g10958 [Popillia japonica]|uniref:Uncharacterized protein n=1 Tax=Popillia japonica TaxID=7064 RepID=A0AAW1LT39_POPJA